MQINSLLKKKKKNWRYCFKYLDFFRLLVNCYQCQAKMNNNCKCAPAAIMITQIPEYGRSEGMTGWTWINAIHVNSHGNRFSVVVKRREEERKFVNKEGLFLSRKVRSRWLRKCTGIVVYAFVVLVCREMP